MDSPDATSTAPTTSSEPPTIAAFSPTSYTRSPTHARQRSTILVQQKSPLLVATPPQVTRALAYSHPYILPLNKLLGLVSWTSGDPWESFLMLCVFWAITLYGDVLIRYAGPIVFALVLIGGIWSRRYSPLSSAGWTNEDAAASATSTKPPAQDAESKGRHHKSLDEILDALKLFISRCNTLLDPWIALTDFLSTQRTATSATTRPALTSLFIRILLVTPIWALLTIHPIALITTRRVVLVAGTIFLSWHSRPATVSRAILWRSHLLRQTTALVTGLTFAHPQSPSLHNPTAVALANKHLDSKNAREGLRLTWSLWENQRRWIGIGWTGSMLAYERATWTDDALNAAPSVETFKLPAVEGGVAKWRWVENSHWRVAPQKFADDKASHKDRSSTAQADDDDDDRESWIYYDNKWRDPRARDGWGRYTRRRKWVREAELVEVDAGTGEDSEHSAWDAAPSARPGALTPRPSDQRLRLSKKELRSREKADKAADKADKAERKARDKADKAQGRARRDTGESSVARSSLDAPSLRDADARSVGSSASRKDRASWFRRRKGGEGAKGLYAAESAASSALDVAHERGPAAGSGEAGEAGGKAAVEETGLASSPEDDVEVPLRFRGREGEGVWGVGEDAGMELG